MKFAALIFSLVISQVSVAHELAKPKLLKTKELSGFADFTETQKDLVTKALKIREEHGWIPYKFAGANPQKGGFDCSGAMFFLLNSLAYKPPRTSSAQFMWLKKNQTLTLIGPKVSSLDDPVFKKLNPGDLLFWSGTYLPTDGRKTKVTHVGIYLGKEKKDGHHVMASASDGRSYRGARQSGYGVFDFKLPRKSSRAKLVGFGPPPKPTP